MSKLNWPLMPNIIRNQDKNALIRFIKKSDRFTNGEQVKLFEQKWSSWLGAKHSTFVNSGSSANFISLEILKKIKGQKGEVIVPPLAWISDIAAIYKAGFTPVFVDIDFHNLSISYENILRAITKKTKAVLIIHLLGLNALNENILKIVKDNNLFLIEDCCEAHGATFKNKKVGSYGHISNFSFYYGHHMTTIEGGMVSTSNREVYELSKVFRSHGLIREASYSFQKKYINNKNIDKNFIFGEQGYNFRSTELNAVIGLSQLKYLDKSIKRRKYNLKKWLENLDKDIFFTDFLIKGNSSFALPLILLDKDKNKFKRIQKKLRELNVEFRVGMVGGNQINHPYIKCEKYIKKTSMNNVNHIQDFSLYIGNHTSISANKIKLVSHELNEC